MLNYAKKYPTKFIALLMFISLSGCSSLETPQKNQVNIYPPEELYGDLFNDVQKDNSLFRDSKTFVDASPKYDVSKIRGNYAKLEDKSTNSVLTFIRQNFEIPGESETYKSDSVSISNHIRNLWSVLQRPANVPKSGTLIPLPKPYIVPGGRFREIYYWDSYFTMLGLQEDGELQVVQNMVDNFSYLINTYGFIPNGNRTYYLGRSQPPFYSLMVGILAEMKSDTVYADYASEMEKEYQFWMDGAEQLSEGNSENKRVVRLDDGEILNRYFDSKTTPRPESYIEDVETAQRAVAKNPEKTDVQVNRDLRAAAESGWDFSSRWIKPSSNNQFDLADIETTSILPVDLNSLLYHLEVTLSNAFQRKGDLKKAKYYQVQANKRKTAIQKYFWNEEEQFFMDFQFRNGESTTVRSLAGVYPLFFNLATQREADLVSNAVKNEFLKAGGVVSTNNATGQQWDAPNGWAPLQYITIEGLRNYEHNDLAAEIRDRWLKLNEKVYDANYKLLEKYNVMDITKESGGGEYPTQDGFGWTNGVYQKLAAEKKN